MALLGTRDKPANENELLGNERKRPENSLLSDETKATKAAVYTVIKIVPITTFRPYLAKSVVIIDVIPAARPASMAGIAAKIAGINHLPKC